MDTEQNKTPEVAPNGPIEAVPETTGGVESAPAPEVEASPEQTMDGQEVVVENGEIYQAPPHDDLGDDTQSHAERLAPLPEEEKLWQLKLLARDHSLEKAIAVIKKMNDPWLEDKFHDDLMDDVEWRKQLEALGKIERL
ncbi:MAG: hypothetical protein HYV54_01575 [Parcubacteria group bacterium]|nr:hypothetical protein [Parcubacteria group bacterium]